MTPMTRFLPIAMLVGAVLLWLAPTAAGAECGSTPAGATEPLEGSMLLKSEPSTTSLEFGRSAGTKRMIFVFEISNCTLNSAGGLTAKVHASEGEEAFGEPEFEVEDSQVTVEVPVDPDGFGAGKHTAAVTVNGPTIIGATTKVAFQRTEGAFWPTFIAITCALAGIGAAILIKIIPGEPKLRVKPKRFVFAVAGGLFAAGAVWKTAYVDAEIWQATLTAVLGLIIGTTTAAFGAAGGALVGESVKPK
jgi:hypothetical protein